MKKCEVLVLIGLLIGVMMLSGCIEEEAEKSSGQQQTEKGITSISECEKTVTTKEYNDCITKVAVVKKEVSLCKNIDEDRRDACTMEVAVAKQDFSLCKKKLI